jgi:hypothetical protein
MALGRVDMALRIALFHALVVIGLFQFIQARMSLGTL